MCCKNFQEFADEVFHGGFTVFGKLLFDPVGHDGVHGKAIVSEQATEAVDGRGFHFEIGNAVLAEAEIGEPVDQLGVTYTEAQNTALGSVEAGAGNRDALVKTGNEVLEQGRSGAVNIGMAHLPVQLGMGDEGLDEFVILFVLFVAVEIEQVVDAQAVCGGHEAVDRYIGLQGTGGADADDIDRTELFFDLAGVEIDINECVEFVHHDIDIIGTDTGGKDGDAFTADAAGMGDKLAVLAFHFDGIEIFAHFFNAVGIADGDNGTGDFFGAEVEVVNGSAVIDDQFRFCYTTHTACFC